MNISSILLEAFFEEILRRSPRKKGIVEVTGLIIEKKSLQYHCREFFEFFFENSRMAFARKL